MKPGRQLSKMKIVGWDSIKNENYPMGLLELCGKCEDNFVVAIWLPLLYCIRQGKASNQKERYCFEGE